jgi:hypothetical protein
MLQWVQFLLFLSVQHDMHGGSASAGAQDYHFIANESVLPSSISGKKQAREKKSCSQRVCIHKGRGLCPLLGLPEH